MEKVSSVFKEEGMVELPPGFRFHPTDEELISQYLYNKVTDTNFTARAIGEVDMNRCEPWDLPWKAKMGEKEWYFFCMKDRKYPTGLRTNRATEAGYWKATGKDKEIFKGKSLVGFKKTLVFYIGRAPKGEKSNWVMHEYRFHSNFTLNYQQQTPRNEWVICRVFHKSLALKKIHNISGIMKLDSYGNELGYYGVPQKPINDSGYVPCFSNPIDNVETNNNNNNNQGGNFDPFTISSSTQGFHQVQAPVPANSSLPGSVYNMQDHTMMRNLYDNGSNIVKVGFKSDGEMVSVSQETCLTTDMNAETSSVMSSFDMCRLPFHNHHHSSVASTGLDGLWNY